VAKASGVNSNRIAPSLDTKTIEAIGTISTWPVLGIAAQ
jgi:hypothetical protein